jgi:lipoate-protein ligase A
LTYSLALPTSDRRAASAEQLYVLVHDAIITALADGKSCGATPFSLARWDGPSATRMADEPFLCFQRRSAGDVVATRPGDAKNHKIVGSAQRRRRGALLQHGSVLLETSPAAPELAGIRELTDLRTNADKLAELLAVRIPTALGENFQPVKLSCDLKIAAEEIQRSKYDRAGWLTRR